MKENDHISLAACLVCTAIVALGAYLSLKYLLGYVLPFLVAWGAGALVRPAARELNRRTRIPIRACAFFMMLILLCVTVLLGALAVNVIIAEGQSILTHLLQNSERIAEYLGGVLDNITSALNSLPVIGNRISADPTIGASVGNSIVKIVTELVASLAGLISSIAAGIPDAFLGVLVSIVASFYFALDMDMINEFLLSHLPENVCERARRLAARTGRGLSKYLRASLILYVITFSQLLIGFLILGVDRALTLSALIAFVDMLPLLGTAAVLLPWGVLAILTGETALGIGLLILLSVMTVLRQIAEPKIVGKSLGVHPLLTLVAMYGGYALFGAVGMIAAPVALAVLAAGGQENGS